VSTAGNGCAGLQPGAEITKQSTNQAHFEGKFGATQRLNYCAELFPELTPAASLPTMPKPESRRADILEALRKGDRLTHIDALRRGWGWRLAADIHALAHDHGWPIVSVMIPQSGGNEIALYWLPAGVK